MRKIFLLCALCAFLASQAEVASFGKPLLYNDGWKFSLKDDSTARYQNFDDSQWRTLNLPHDWSIELPLSPDRPSCQGYLPGGIGWYRKSFEKPDDLALHYIYFEGVYNRSDVYINGHHLGHRPNGYVSFLYDITPYLQDGENVIAVRVDHSRNADSRWYTGSGIYRDVYLISAPESHFALWGIGWRADNISADKAVVTVDAAVENPQKGQAIVAKLIDAQGKEVAAKRLTAVKENNSLTLSVKKPQLWDLDHPYLYSLEVSLLDKNQVIDSDVEPVGLRTIAFNPDNGLTLNGKNIKAKGVCIHHDAGTLGAAVPRDVWKRRLANLKKLGVNAIRMSHNPQAPMVYDICDEMGLLVMDEVSDEWEFPKRKWVTGWNDGTPAFEGSFDFFEEWINRDVTDMVRRDRCHPSIFLWSIGNEVDYPNDPYSHPVLDGSEINQPMYGGYDPEAPDARRIGDIAKRLVACVKAVDTSRPTTGAMAGVVMSNETDYPGAIDICGYNYTENKYAEDHAAYPERVIYGSENSVQYDAWRAVKDNDYIFGQFLWTGIDYLGESRTWPSRGLNTGLLNFGAFPKPRGHFRASLWADEPVCYLGTYPTRGFHYGPGRKPKPSIEAPAIWNYDDGQSVMAVCYTNAPFAKLLLNGEEVGSLRPYDEETGVYAWEIEYAPGELVAIGCDSEGNEVSRSSIVTSDRPYALRARIDGDATAQKGGVNHILVEVVDEKGNLVTLADNNITCLINGPATLLGLEGSNNTDMGNYRDAEQRAYMGSLLAYVRNDCDAPHATVTFSSPLLQPVTVVLPIDD